jgi:hypothetical protein
MKRSGEELPFGPKTIDLGVSSSLFRVSISSQLLEREEKRAIN